MRLTTTMQSSLLTILCWSTLFFSSAFVGRALGQGFVQAKPWMGIMIETKENDGVQIKDIVPGTPAEKAGLVSGDIVKKIDDVKMTDAMQLISYIQSRGVGNKVSVEFVRAGKSMNLTLKLEAKPDDLELIRKSLVGKKVPEFKLDHVELPNKQQDKVIKKEAFTSKDISGRVAVIEFWATWCPACRDSHGQLSKFAEENPNIAVLAVSDEELPELQAYQEKIKPKFLNLRDSNREFIKHFMVSAIPMIVIVDKTGTISFATLGGGAYLEEALTLAKETASKK